MIRVEVTKAYSAAAESVEFVLDVRFETQAPVTALFGPSGAGKTLTLDCIAGFVRPDAGRIVVEDAVLFDSGSGVHLEPRFRQCGYVFQNYALFPHMTLRTNLEFGVPAAARDAKRRQVGEMLERFRLVDVAGRRPHELSGGQKQRASIARALLARPRVLLLDEPSRGLDLPLRRELYQTLRGVWQDFQTPMILVTHDMEECFELATAMAVYENGRVVQLGSPREVVERPATVEVARLMGADNVLAVTVEVNDFRASRARLRLGTHLLETSFLPGREAGEHCHLLVRPDQLWATAGGGRPGANQISGTLARVTEQAVSARLEFDDGLVVILPRNEYERSRGARDWVVEFPASLRLV